MLPTGLKNKDYEIFIINGCIVDSVNCNKQPAGQDRDYSFLDSIKASIEHDAKLIVKAAPKKPTKAETKVIALYKTAINASVWDTARFFNFFGNLAVLAAENGGTTGNATHKNKTREEIRKETENKVREMTNQVYIDKNKSSDKKQKEMMDILKGIPPQTGGFAFIQPLRKKGLLLTF